MRFFSHGKGLVSDCCTKFLLTILIPVRAIFSVGTDCMVVRASDLSFIYSAVIFEDADYFIGFYP